MKTEYAILDNDGKFLTSPNEHGSGSYIALMDKEDAKKEIEMYYRGKGYSVRKMKVK